jgi:quercetin dioxygenase-like cupin family protein
MQQLRACVQHVKGVSRFAEQWWRGPLIDFLLEQTEQGHCPSASQILEHFGRLKSSNSAPAPKGQAPSDPEATARKRVMELREVLKRPEMACDGYRIDVVRYHYRLRLVDGEPRELRESVNASEFARLVRALCELEGIDAEQRTALFNKFLAQETGPAIYVRALVHVAQLERNLGTVEFDRFCALLEHQLLGIDVARAIAEAFDIHTLLLDPLRSKALPVSHLPLDLQGDFFEFVGSAGRADEERRTYSVPYGRLEGSGVSFVTLKLKPRAQSDLHEHPGDELVLCLSGEIDVVFPDTGFTNRLREGEFMHYYAEQRHGAVAAGKSGAELFIVRVFHVDGQGTRQAISQQLRAELTKNDASGPPTFSRHALDWIHQVLPAYRGQPAGEIKDLLGIRRFLECCGVDLDNSATASLAGRDATIRDISHRFEIPEFLLAGFAHPAASNAVVVRKEEFRPTAAPLPSGFEHDVPCRSLSCSDISIARATFTSVGPRTDGAPVRPVDRAPNRHPGSEAILLLEGAITLHFDGEEKPACALSREGPQLVHFDCSRRHWVENSEPDKTARFFVIRFYRDRLMRI